MRIHLLLGLALAMQLTEQTFVFFGRFNKGKREGQDRKISSGRTSANKLRSYGGYNHGSRRVKYQTRLTNKGARQSFNQIRFASPFNYNQKKRRTQNYSSKGSRNNIRTQGIEVLKTIANTVTQRPSNVVTNNNIITFPNIQTNSNRGQSSSVRNVVRVQENRVNQPNQVNINVDQSNQFDDSSDQNLSIQEDNTFDTVEPNFTSTRTTTNSNNAVTQNLKPTIVNVSVQQNRDNQNQLNSNTNYNSNNLQFLRWFEDNQNILPNLLINNQLYTPNQFIQLLRNSDLYLNGLSITPQQFIDALNQNRNLVYNALNDADVLLNGRRFSRGGLGNLIDVGDISVGDAQDQQVGQFQTVDISDSFEQNE